MNAIEKAATELATVTSSIPEGLAITHDVRLRQAQAEMMSRYHMAMMLPRNWTGVGAKLLAACDNPDFAKTAVYSKPAGNDKIEGLSIRFAELALQLMRNISIDTQPEMEDSLSVHYRMTVTDMESNTPTSETFKVEKTVERRYKDDDVTVLAQRKNTKGDVVYLLPATEDQITTKLRAQVSKVKRTLILALIPAEIRNACMDRCKKTMAADVKADPQAATKSVVSAFLSIGVDVPDLKEYLGHSPGALVDKEIGDLRGIFALIRDGEMTWGDVMEAKRERDAQVKPGSKAAFLDQKQKDRQKAKADKVAKAAKVKAAADAAAATDAGASTTPPASPKEEPARKTRASRRGDDAPNETTTTSTPVDDDAPPASE